MINTSFFNGLVVFGAALLMSLSSLLVRRKFASQEQSSKWQEEVKIYNADKERAKKTGDKKLSSRLRKQEKRINQIQGKMMKGQLISVAANMGIFFILYQLLIAYIGDKTVAYLPFSIPFIIDTPYSIPFFYWYLVCSFFSSLILQRIFGVNIGMGMPSQTSGQ